MNLDLEQNHNWVIIPYNRDLQILEVKTDIENISKAYKPLVFENKWRTILEKLETDLKMMNHNEIVEHFLNTWVYKHIVHLDSPFLFQILKKELSLLEPQLIRKKVYSNKKLLEYLFSSDNWKEFLFQMFEECTAKEDINPNFQVILMFENEERYFNSIKNNSKLKDKMDRASYRSPFFQIINKLKQKED